MKYKEITIILLTFILLLENITLIIGLYKHFNIIPFIVTTITTIAIITIYSIISNMRK